jgi:hypothetical protein
MPRQHCPPPPPPPCYQLTQQPPPVLTPTSAPHETRPGNGWNDTNHDHTGPPGHEEDKGGNGDESDGGNHWTGMDTEG